MHLIKINRYLLFCLEHKVEGLPILTINRSLLSGMEKFIRHYSISNKQSYSILKVAKMFESKIKYLDKRPGERYSSALTHMNLSNKVYRYFGKTKLKDYINNIIKKK